jgi:hypothetical protein
MCGCGIELEEVKEKREVYWVEDGCIVGSERKV